MEEGLVVVRDGCRTSSVRSTYRALLGRRRGYCKDERLFGRGVRLGGKTCSSWEKDVVVLDLVLFGYGEIKGVFWQEIST